MPETFANCPQCSGPVWNNVQKVSEGWRGPMFSCKDKESCKWVHWGRPKGANPGRKPNNNITPREPKWTWAQLSTMYRESLRIAGFELKRFFPETSSIKPTAADIIAATATVFICATRDGIRTEVPLDQPPPGIQDTDDDREIDDRFSRARRA